MSRLIFATFLASSAAEPNSLFVDFKAKFSLDFGEADATRETIFLENVRYINEVNAKNLSYQLGINKFTHLTNEEFRDMMSLRGFKQAGPPSLRSDSKSMQGAFEFTGNPDDLPESVDWRKEGYVTPVKNQGQCGSCWAFSATGALEGLNKNTTGKLVSLSEKQLVDCSGSFGNHGCSGGLMDQAFQYVEANGLESEGDYQYTASDGTCHAKKSENVLKAGTIGFRDVEKNSANSLLAALANNGPVSVAIEASGSIFQHYKSGVITDASCGTQLDHGVLAVGYSRTQSPNNDVPHFIVKNSWGGDWGEEGYLRIAINGSKEGTCGILMFPTYPIKK